ncbi:uncharacterized protein LOC141585816 [Silene latifolia]|uniref:uncharacterized protein LOC141585816 n=1 Tax=Silene latifolia TaxID=37657 RepID=UPI003D76AA75
MARLFRGRRSSYKPPDDGYTAYERYMKVAKESDVYITFFTASTFLLRGPLCGGIVEMHKSETLVYEEAIEAANYAVDDYNKAEKTDLVFDAIVKANGQMVGGFMYYITLRAHSLTHKRPKIYQAKVWSMVDDNFEVLIFRERPKRCQSPGLSSTIQNAEENVAKPLYIRKGAFIRFMKYVRKLPELVNMRYSYVTKLASRSWKSMSAQEKARHSSDSRSLKYEDIEDYMSDVSE